MAIVAQIVVESRRYSGWIDARYPIGYWQAALTLTGNVSGGALAIDLVFQGAEPAFLNSQMYSVERFSASTTENASKTVKVSAVNMGGPDNEGFSHEYAVLLADIGGVATGGILQADAMNIVPWFLGSQRTPGITASLSLLTANIDGETLKFEAEGYRWSARSVLIDGGPQRPPTGPYR